MPIETRVCLSCGKKFDIPSWRTSQKYCSQKCNGAEKLAQKNHNWKDKTTIICKQCGKTVVLSPWQFIKGQKFCSKICSDTFKTGKTNTVLNKKIKKICHRCGKEYRVSPHRNSISFYCSNSCRSLDKNGEKSGRWEGGIAFLPYPPTFNNQFKRMIRERDNYTCAICKGYGNHVHHINYVKMDTVPENCITLCNSCHTKTNSNREYWIEWFSNYRATTQARK